jgi:hypothetical protein
LITAIVVPGRHFWNNWLDILNGEPTMDNIISLETLLELAKRRKTPAYFYVLRKNRITCFTGNYIYDINNANMIIRQVECNNTAHKRETAFH